MGFIIQVIAHAALRTCMDFCQQILPNATFQKTKRLNRRLGPLLRCETWAKPVGSGASKQGDRDGIGHTSVQPRFASCSVLSFRFKFSFLNSKKAIQSCSNYIVYMNQCLPKPLFFVHQHWVFFLVFHDNSC